MNNLFFILSLSKKDIENKNIEECLSLNNNNFEDLNIISVENNNKNIKSFFGFSKLKKEFEKDEISFKFKLKIDNEFSSKEQYNLKKNQIKFIDNIEFNDYKPNFFVKIFKDAQNAPSTLNSIKYEAIKIFEKEIKDIFSQEDKENVYLKNLIENYINYYENSHDKSFILFAKLFNMIEKIDNSIFENLIKKFSFPKYFSKKEIEIEDFSKNLNEKLNELNFYEYINNKDNKFIENLIKISLYYFYNYEIDNYYNFICKNDEICEISLKIINNNSIFKKFKEENLLFFIGVLKNTNNLNNIFNLSSSLIECEEAIIKNFEKLSNLYEQMDNSIIINQTLDVENKNIILSFKKYFEINTKKNFKNLFFKIKDDNILYYIDKINKFDDISKLINIFKNLNKFYKNDVINKNILEKLFDKYHEIGVQSINDKKFNNLQIIKFINEDSHIDILGEENANNKYIKQYRKDKQNLNLINFINYKNITTEFINEFRNIKFHSIYGIYDNYNEFIIKIFSKASDLKEFFKIFQLFFDKRNKNDINIEKSKKEIIKKIKTINE